MAKKGPAPEPKKAPTATKAVAAKPASTEPKTDKSIVDPKYRNKYKTPDWLGEIIMKVASPVEEKKVTVKDGEGSKTVTKKIAGAVNVAALFALAKENNIDVSKYEKGPQGHGFGGRMRMTIRNMLQAVVKQRHGITVNGKWSNAPAEWLAAKKAPEAVTHKRTGEKIAVAKPAKEKVAAA